MNLKKFILKIVRVIVDTTKFQDFDSDNILIIEKLHGHILIYDIAFKTTIGTKPLRIIFNQIKGWIRAYNRTIYLILFSFEKYDAIYNRFLSHKSGITIIFYQYYSKIKVDSYDPLHIEKLLTLYNVIILIKSILNEDQNHYNYSILVEKMFVWITWNRMTKSFLIV